MGMSVSPVIKLQPGFDPGNEMKSQLRIHNRERVKQGRVSLIVTVASETSDARHYACRLLNLAHTIHQNKTKFY